MSDRTPADDLPDVIPYTQFPRGSRRPRRVPTPWPTYPPSCSRPPRSSGSPRPAGWPTSPAPAAGPGPPRPPGRRRHAALPRASATAGRRSSPTEHRPRRPDRRPHPRRAGCARTDAARLRRAGLPRRARRLLRARRPGRAAAASTSRRMPGGCKADYPDNCRAVHRSSAGRCWKRSRTLGFPPDVIHANDWQTGLVPVYLAELYRHAAAATSRIRIAVHDPQHRLPGDVRRAT